MFADNARFLLFDRGGYAQPTAIVQLSNRGPMRMRSILFSLALLFVVPTFGGCSLIQGFLNKGEPPSGPDAVPPPDYAPIYVQRIGQFSPDAANTAVQITRVDVSNPSLVKAYVHVVDSSGTYLSGAAAGNWKSWWCDIREEIGTISRPVDNFTVREVTENDREPHAVALVMDHSGSMGEARARAVQNAAEALVGAKKGEDRLAFIKYDSDVMVEVPVTDDPTMLRSGLGKDGLQGFGGMTAIGDGISAGIEQVSQTSAERKAVIIFTDGLDNSSTIPRDSVIAMAQRAGVIICAVDFGQNTSPDYLKAVAGATGGSYYKIYQTSEFDLVFEDIYRRLRNYYVLEYRPTEYGIHRLVARLCLDRDSVSTFASYDNTPDIGTVALLNVFFDVAKADIKPESKPAVDNVYGLMTAVPTLKIELRGHTDSTNSTGDPNYNVKLSQQRADAVRDALIRRGIDGGRIRAIGFGESMPVATNTTAEGRAQNRRTEFVIIEK